MTEKRGEVHGLLLLFLRAWYGMAPMTLTGSFLRSCMVCSCVLSLGVMPALAAAPAGDSATVQKLAHSLEARVGMAAVMLDTGETVSIGDEAAYPMQSVFKFILALSVLKQVDEGKLDLEQIIHIRPEQLLKDTWSPLRERFPQGGDFSLKELLRVTVQESDNNTCDLLFALIGGTGTVQKDLKEWGISGINVRFTENEMLRNHDLQYVNSSRPSAMNALLRAFDEGKILNKDTQRFLWDIMAGCSTGATRLKGKLPQDYVVAHKTGSGFTTPEGVIAAVNDVGIIVLPNGRKMAVSVFVMDSKDSLPACEKMIASMARWLCTEWQPAAAK